jgi:hypothetical protein
VTETLRFFEIVSNHWRVLLGVCTNKGAGIMNHKIVLFASMALPSLACSTAVDPHGSESLGQSQTAITAAGAMDAPSYFVTKSNSDSTITIHTMPWAECTLGPATEGGVAADSQMKVHANDQGEVQLHARPATAQASSGRITVTCRDEDGQEATKSGDFVVDAASGGISANIGTVGTATTSPHARTMRPAFVGDALSVSDEEVQAQGFPPRPDPLRSPEAYHSWMKVVSQPSTVVATRSPESSRFERPNGHAQHNNEIKSGAGTSSNWSGIVLHNTARTYNGVLGEWVVPSINIAGATTGIEPFAASLWVGLDGADSPDVVQTGTNEATTSWFGMAMLVNSYAWMEWFPWNESYLFSVNPGDEMFAEVWRCATPWYCSTGGASCFYIEDLSSGVTSGIVDWGDCSYTFGGNPPFVGNNAEWILERPSINGTLESLPDYSSALMSSAWAWDSAGNWLNWQTDTGTEWVNMVNGSDYLSLTFPINATQIDYWWFGYN